MTATQKDEEEKNPNPNPKKRITLINRCLCVCVRVTLALVQFQSEMLCHYMFVLGEVNAKSPPILFRCLEKRTEKMSTDDEDTKREQRLLFDVDAAPVDSSKDPSGYYAALGVAVGSAPSLIRTAFLNLSQAYHTDKHSQQDQETQMRMTVRFQQIQQAYQVLSDERRRAAYDHSGAQGVNRLELIPVSVNSKDDVLRILDALKQEAELRSTARLISATGALTLTYSVAHFFEGQKRRPKRRTRTPPQLPASLMEKPPKQDAASPQQQCSTPTVAPREAPHNPAVAAESSTPVGVAANTPVALNNPPIHLVPPTSAASVTPEHGEKTNDASNKLVNDSTNTNPQVGQDGSTEPTKQADTTKQREVKAVAPKPPANGQQQVQLREVEIDGKKVVVAVLPDILQAQVREKLKQGNQTLASAAASIQESGAHGRTSGTAAQPPAMSFLSKVVFALQPKALSIQQTFQYPITPSISSQFRAEASQNVGGNLSAAVTTQVDYAASGITAYGSSWRASLNSIRWTVFHKRLLSKLWTLRTKLTVLDGSNLLSQLRLTLTRKLSDAAEIASTISWAGHGGYFETTIAKVTDTAQAGAVVNISAGSLVVTGYQVKNCIFDKGEAMERKGKVQQSISFNPFTGQTMLAYEMWLFKSKLNHFGIGISSTLPYSLSPIHPPYFLSVSSTFVSICQLNLLFARGEHKISLPIIITASKTIRTGFLWLSLPWALYRLGSLAAKPLMKLWTQRDQLIQRRRCKVEVETSRENALREQRALEPMVLRRRAVEEKQRGLVITKAVYGVLGAQDVSVYPLDIDVSIPLQNFVIASRLSLPAGNKDSLVGFYDVDPPRLESRSLRIEYELNGERRVVTFGENDEISLPRGDENETAGNTVGKHNE